MPYKHLNAILVVGLSALAVNAFAASPATVDQVHKLIGESKFEDAEALAKKNIAASPRDLSWRLCLLETYQQSGNHKMFLSTLEELAASFKADGDKVIEDLLPFPARYFNSGKAQFAVETYERLLKVFPSSAKVLSSLGAVYAKQGELTRALDLFERAQKIDPKDPIILRNVGESAIYAGDMVKASQALRAYLALNPAETSVYFDLAMIAMAESPTASLPLWKEYHQAAKKHSDGQWEQSANAIEAAVRKGMGTDGLLDLASQMNASKAGKYSIPILLYLEKQEPNEAIYPYLMAQSYEVGGFPTFTRQQLLKAEQLIATHPSKHGVTANNVKFQLGTDFLKTGEYTLALERFLIVEKSEPKTQNIQYSLAWALMALGKVDQAKGYFEQCLKLSNNQANLQKYCTSNLQEIAKMELVPSIEPYRAKVKADAAKSRAAQAYDGQFFMAAMKAHSDEVASCTRTAGSEQLTLVPRVASDGTVEKVFYSSPSQASVCLAEFLVDLKGPPPPLAPIHIELQIKNQI